MKYNMNELFIVKYNGVDILRYIPYKRIDLNMVEYMYCANIVDEQIIMIMGEVCDEHQLDIFKPNRQRNIFVPLFFENPCDDVLNYQALERL